VRSRLLPRRPRRKGLERAAVGSHDPLRQSPQDKKHIDSRRGRDATTQY
jgi:hypothetical protein